MPDAVRIGVSTTKSEVHAVALNHEKEVLAQACSERSVSLETSVFEVLSDILSQITARQIGSVAFATDWLMEQLDARIGLTKVAVLRIGLTSTGIPPFAGWPADLTEKVEGLQQVIAGGSDIDGSRLAQLDTTAIRNFAHHNESEGSSVAVSTVFAPLNNHDENLADKILSETSAIKEITLSHSVGGFGLFERENAAILNASLRKVGSTLTNEIQSCLDRLGITAELFFAQNNGTLLSSEAASAMPVRILNSRLATAVNGVAQMSGIKDAIVLDFDEEKPKVAVLKNGSVSLHTDRSIFGGVEVIQSLPRGFELPRGLESIRRLQHHARNVPLLAVGNKANSATEATAEINVIENSAYVSAIGVASADVSASISGYISADQHGNGLVEQLEQRAIEETILVGAHPSHTEVIAIEEAPITHMAGEPRRVTVTAAGPPFSFKDEIFQTQKLSIERNIR